MFKQPDIICTGIHWDGEGYIYLFLLSLPYFYALKLSANHCFSAVSVLGLNSPWPHPIYSVVSVGWWHFADSVEKLSSYLSYPRGERIWSLCEVAASRKIMVFSCANSQWKQLGRLLGAACFLGFFPFKIFLISFSPCSHDEIRWWDGTTFFTPLKPFPSLQKIMQHHVLRVGFLKALSIALSLLA